LDHGCESREDADNRRTIPAEPRLDAARALVYKNKHGESRRAAPRPARPAPYRGGRGPGRPSL